MVPHNVYMSINEAIEHHLVDKVVKLRRMAKQQEAEGEEFAGISFAYELSDMTPEELIAIYSVESFMAGEKAARGQDYRSLIAGAIATELIARAAASDPSNPF